MEITGAWAGISPGGSQTTAGRVRNSGLARPGRETPPEAHFAWPGWLLRISELLRRWRTENSRPSRLALVERISLGPRQALLLVEAEGARLLVATSSDGSTSFYPLSATRPAKSGVRGGARPAGRVSW